MRGKVGPRGLAVLVLAGIAGVALAIVGWSQRGTGLVAPSVGGLGASAPSHTATTATNRPRPAATTSAATTSAGPSAQPGATTSAGPSARPSATTSAGPLLSAQPYAPFAFLVWPGTVSTAAQQAMTGLIVSVSRQAGGISVRAGVAGQPLPPAHFYAGGGKVYILESSLSDDSSNLDYNLGDDGLVVTNLQGRIVQ